MAVYRITCDADADQSLVEDIQNGLTEKGHTLTTDDISDAADIALIRIGSGYVQVPTARGNPKMAILEDTIPINLGEDVNIGIRFKADDEDSTPTVAERIVGFLDGILQR